MCLVEIARCTYGVNLKQRSHFGWRCFWSSFGYVFVSQFVYHQSYTYFRCCRSKRLVVVGMSFFAFLCIFCPLFFLPHNMSIISLSALFTKPPSFVLSSRPLLFLFCWWQICEWIFPSKPGFLQLSVSLPKSEKNTETNVKICAFYVLYLLMICKKIYTTQRVAG